MSRWKLSSAICILSLAPLAANAADMPSIPIAGPSTQVTEFFSAWYLRLDGGYRFNQTQGGIALGAPFGRQDIENSAVIGGGVGYKWSWFRSDVTVDYGPRATFEGVNTVPQQINAKIENFTTLLNGYADLGTWWGFTPYVGAGIGFSFLKPSRFLITPGTIPLAPISDDSRWTTSWAVMAGLSYAISPVFLVDASYRFLDLGVARNSVASIVTPGGISTLPTQVRYGDWTAQEIRLGLRYLIP
jgi:opacity protein-like surface antigen